MIRTLTPNPSFDHTYEVARFDTGEVNRADRVSIAAAGKGVNVARNAVANGHAATAVIPGDAADGGAFAAELARFDVGCEIVARTEPTRRNITVVDRVGTTTKINEGGAALDDDVAERLITAAATGDDLIAACGSLPPGTDSTFYARLAEAVAEPGRRLAVDTSGAALHACLDVPLLVAKPNRAELEELVEDRLETYGDLVDVATDLVRRGWSNVLVSLGGSGAVLVNRRGAWVGDAPISTIANTVGAGDAALTGFLCEPAGDDKALASALAFGRATVAQVSTAGAIVDEADRAAVRLRPVDPTESLGEETG